MADYGLIEYTVMSLLEAPCAKTSWRALLFRTILGITGALIVCFDNWWFKQPNNSETCFGGHYCDFEQHVPCLAVYVCMNSEWSSYLRRPALLFCVGATIPWQCADSFGGGGGGGGGGGWSLCVRAVHDRFWDFAVVLSFQNQKHHRVLCQVLTPYVLLCM